MQTLSTLSFIQFLLRGANKVIENEDYLNKLNFFPVSDHDTGTNVASLMRYLQAEDYPTSNYSELFTKIADAALFGAAGNSGIIFAAYFNGFTAVTPSQELTVKDFISSQEKAVDEAYRAVLQPVEGTILTVMKAWVTACQSAYHDGLTYHELFDSALPSTRSALAATKMQLPHHSEDANIDAGACAFYFMLEGMHDYLCNPLAVDNHVKVSTHNPINEYHDEPDYASSYRYCFESIISTTASSKEEIINAVEHEGDCVVITSSPHYLKIHMHTNNPFSVTQYLKTLGDIIYQKIDDINMQAAISHDGKKPIALVTDSAADLPVEFINQHAIHVFPVLIRVGKHQLLDKLTVNLDDIYTDVEHNKPSTAVPSANQIQRLFSFLSSHYESIIVMTISSKLSGMYQQICLQASKFHESKITVIDTMHTAGSHGLLVMKAAELINQHKSHDEVVDEIRKSIKESKIFVYVGNFATAQKSGRLPRTLTKFITYMQFKPIISLDQYGSAKLHKILFGQERSVQELINLAVNQIKQLKRYVYCIIHSQEIEIAQKVGEMLKSIVGQAPLYIQEVSIAVGVHIGKGSVAVAYLDDEKGLLTQSS